MVGVEHIAFCSGGKDSAATIILDHLHEKRIQKIVHCEVMYDDTLSAEYPEHTAFLNNVLFPTFEKWGYEVVRLRADKTFLDCFYHQRGTRSKNEGKIVGFMVSGHCDVQGLCKLKPIREYLRSLNTEYLEYVGIAADEPQRLASMHQKGQISLLEKYGLTEQDAIRLASEYGLLSPIYTHFKRSGCFFCPNASKEQLRYLYFEHPKLYQKLLALEQVPGKVCDTFCFGKSYQTYAQMFQKEGKQLSIFDL